MSSMSLTLDTLAPARVPLPVNSYFCAETFQREMALIFDGSPRYVGHELQVPEIGDYLALAQENEGRALVRHRDGLQLISNVCRHRQAIMLKGRGRLGQAGVPANIVCPLHRWTYDLRGQLLGAPHFEHDPCLHLKNEAIQNWHGLVFEAPKAGPHRTVADELSGLSVAADLDFSGYAYHSTRLHECDYNWKTFIEVYLEDYHVGPFHPGLGHFVTCQDLRWDFGTHHSVQTVGLNAGLTQSGSSTYQRWQSRLMDYRQGQTPKQGAIWLTLYPTVMVEWYPEVLVVSTLHPISPQKTLNMVSYFYPEEVQAFEPELIEAQQAAYWETCVEDDDIALRMDAGRLALMARGDDEWGPYQSPMEDGMRHFHQWYRQVMGLGG